MSAVDRAQNVVNTNLISSGTSAREKVNLRRPDVMAAVQEQVESHYRSDIVDKVRRNGGLISVGDVTVRLAKQFDVADEIVQAHDASVPAKCWFVNGSSVSVIEPPDWYSSLTMAPWLSIS